ncbi:hypothetical protein N5079_15360 [Planotetraspora sp. A-T 1434]|uniref:hypothetical protein n=1 Tax=Planotetraspora sp. A-T 1434 TaxID=2979219 RepID=UPI0021C0DB36|nr:hypothetical protein [Planotetraspora sp. A-T 1434]MCT9931592.1 hypothetical protein [Planotetraspora sp. A-T 1434]
MTPRLLKEIMEEWSREVSVPGDLADRALRGRSRGRVAGMAGMAGLAGAVTAAVVLMMVLVTPKHTAPAKPVTVGSRPEVIRLAPAHAPPAKVTRGGTSEGNVRSDTESSPPRTAIAAGRVAVSAYWTGTWRDSGSGRQVLDRTWYLLDPVTGVYGETEWGFLDVAPGLRYAAVLEKALPVRRIGIFDMETRHVLAWIGVGHPVGGVSWSPDGTKLVATAYDRHPDEETVPAQEMIDGTRTGLYVVDVATATAGEFHPMDLGLADNMNQRRDFGWSDDGSLLYEWDVSPRHKVFYDLEGRPHAAPAGYVPTESKAGFSPDGTLLAGRDGLPTKVTERATGRVVGTQQVLQLLAWADDDHLIGLGCAGSCANEFDNGLVLVSVDGKDTVQLSVNRRNALDESSWQFLLTLR